MFKKRYLKPSDFRIEYPLLKKLMSKRLYVEKRIHSILFKKLFKVFIFVLHVFQNITLSRIIDINEKSLIDVFVQLMQIHSFLISYVWVEQSLLRLDWRHLWAFSFPFSFEIYKSLCVRLCSFSFVLEFWIKLQLNLVFEFFLL